MSIYIHYCEIYIVLKCFLINSKIRFRFFVFLDAEHTVQSDHCISISITIGLIARLKLLFRPTKQEESRKRLFVSLLDHYNDDSVVLLLIGKTRNQAFFTTCLGRAYKG